MQAEAVGDGRAGSGNSEVAAVWRFMAMLDQVSNNSVDRSEDAQATDDPHTRQ